MKSHHHALSKTISLADSGCARSPLCEYYAGPCSSPTGKALASLLRNKVVYEGRPADLLAELQKMFPVAGPGMTPLRFTRWLRKCGGRLGSFRVLVTKKSGRRWVAILAGGDPVTERCANEGAV